MTFDLTAHGDDQSPLARYKNETAQPRASTPSLNELPFDPVPPLDMKPPLAETPRFDEKGRTLRNYQLHPSRNRFFLRGRILTGGDSPWAFVASLTVVLGITGVWFSTTCVWWWQNESPAVAAVGAYMCLLTISSMLATVREMGFTRPAPVLTVWIGFPGSWDPAAEPRSRSAHGKHWV